MYLKMLHINSSSNEKHPLTVVEDIFDNIHIISKHFEDILCHLHQSWVLPFRTNPRKQNIVLNEKIVHKAEQESCDWLGINHKMTAQSEQPVTEFLLNIPYYIFKVFCTHGHHFFQNNPSQIMVKGSIESGRAECGRPIHKSWKHRQTCSQLLSIERVPILSDRCGPAQQWTAGSPRMSA